jgi:hypothetical protein
MKTKRRVRKRKLVKPRKGQRKKMETQTELPVKVPLCAVTDVLSPSLITMAQQHPTNIAIRTHILAAIKQSIPDEAQTWEQIREWIEYNIKKPDRPIVQIPESTPEPRMAVRVMAQCSDTERGTCRYSVCRNGEGHVGILEADLLSLIVTVERANLGMTELVSRVHDYLTEVANYDISLEFDWDTHETDRHESDHNEDNDTRIDSGDIRAAIVAFLANGRNGDLTFLNEHDRPAPAAQAEEPDEDNSDDDGEDEPAF